MSLKLKNNLNLILKFRTWDRNCAFDTLNDSSKAMTFKKRRIENEMHDIFPLRKLRNCFKNTHTEHHHGNVFNKSFSTKFCVVDAWTSVKQNDFRDSSVYRETKRKCFFCCYLIQMMGTKLNIWIASFLVNIFERTKNLISVLRI